MENIHTHVRGLALREVKLATAVGAKGTVELLGQAGNRGSAVQPIPRRGLSLAASSTPPPPSFASTALSKHKSPSDRRFPDFQRACAGGRGVQLLPLLLLPPLLLPLLQPMPLPQLLLDLLLPTTAECLY